MHAAAVAGRMREDCLPSVLRRVGYRTVYLQAAPLDYMDKVRFMKGAGFDRFLGKSWFRRAYHWNTWGPDDRAYFDQSLAMVDELRRGGAPWLLVMLNVGTHHPYPTDPAFASSYPSGSAERAFDYLDTALAAFVEQLRASGALEDTLLLLASDESLGYLGGDELQRMYSQNWGTLVARTPLAEARVVDQAFQQSDVMAGVLDYLGLVGQAPTLKGRSPFRRYDRPRPIIFGNIYRRQVHAIWNERELLTCSIDLDRCGFLTREDEALVSRRYAERSASPAEVEALRYFIGLSDRVR
jgi:arylsulfatase A-like enzyme